MSGLARALAPSLLVATGLLALAACGGSPRSGGGGGATTLTPTVPSYAAGDVVHIDEVYLVDGVAHVDGVDHPFVTDVHNRFILTIDKRDGERITQVQVTYEIANKREAAAEPGEGHPRGLAGNHYVLTGTGVESEIAVEADGRALSPQEREEVVFDIGDQFNTDNPMQRAFSGRTFRTGEPVGIPQAELASLRGFLMGGGTPTAVTITLVDPAARRFELAGVVESSTAAGHKGLTFTGAVTFDDAWRITSIAATGDVYQDLPVNLTGKLDGKKTYRYAK